MYVPKSKIQTNLTTPGKEYFINDTGNDYSGLYYKMYDGKAYTGKFPGDGVNKLLIKYTIVSPSGDPETPSTATKVMPSLTTSSVPPLFPTEQDYKNGMFNRYFSKKRNEYLFEELTKAQYDQLNDPSSLRFTLYQPFFIKWMLTGEKQKVADFNFYSIRNAEEKEGVLGLNEFLKMDYTKYYK
jgi:hypothetical protein